MKKEKNSKQKYKTNKVVLIMSIVLAVLLIGISVFAFLWYESERKEEPAKNPAVQTQTARQTETEPASMHSGSTESAGETAAETGGLDEQNFLQKAFQNSKSLSLKPYKAVASETGEEISLADLFGSAYRTYGGELTLTQDGAFSYYIGVSKDGDSTGSYTIEENNLSVVYADGKTDVFQMEEAGESFTVIVPMGLYKIYFQY